jgi:hypothetical protein
MTFKKTTETILRKKQQQQQLQSFLLFQKKNLKTISILFFIKFLRATNKRQFLLIQSKLKNY